MKIKTVLCGMLCMCLLSGCSTGPQQPLASDPPANESSVSETTIALTAENASEYLTFSLHGYGGDYSGSYYHSLIAEGTISGIAGYTYENAEIEIEVYFEDAYFSSLHTQTLSDTITLNRGGNGVVNIQREMRWSGGSSRKVNCLGYEIISASGNLIER